MKKDDNRSRGALTGIKVVDFSRMLPGPWCTQMLGDLGADVIKVEQPDVGDLGRHNPPNFKQSSVYFNSVNGNKRGVVLDLSQASDRAKKAHDLIAEADVIVELLSRAASPSGSKSTMRPHERSIHASSIVRLPVSARLGHGPAFPATTLSCNRLRGVMGTGSESELLLVPGFQAGDYAGSAYAVMAILAALYQRRDTGEGRYLDISMFDCLFSMTNVIAGPALARFGGFPVTTVMELYGGNPRYATYPTRDGKAVAVSLLEARIWEFVLQADRSCRSDLCRRSSGAPPHGARRPGRALSGGDRPVLPVQGS